MHAYPILSIAIWLPILVGLLVLAIGSDRNPAPARWVALIGSVVSFIVTIPLITTITVISAVNTTNHIEMPSTPRWYEI